MKKKILLVPVALLLVISLLATGCPAPAPVKPVKTAVIFGWQPSTHHIAVMLALDKGWYEEALAKYGVIYVGEKMFPTGPPEMHAMMAGALDIAYVGATPPISAIGKGLDAKIVAAVQSQGSDIVLLPELAAKYTSPKDLVGLKIATFPEGSIQDTVLKKWLIDNNVNPADVDIRGMGPGDAITALMVRGVDGVFLPHPGPAKLVLEGAGEIVATSYEMWPDHPCCVIVASGEMMRDYPEIVEEIIRIHLRATEYILAHPLEAADVFVRWVGFPEEVTTYSMKVWDGTFITDPHAQVEGVLEYAIVNYDLGYIDRVLTVDDLYDFTFYNKVAAELNWSDARLDQESYKKKL